MKHWQVFALKYAERDDRVRSESFIGDDHPGLPHGMDYFVWLITDGARHILVDTGFYDLDATRRCRPTQRDPASALAALGIEADDIETVIITHLHYDHAGGLHRYPNAQFHLQEAEMAFATGPCMCHQNLRMPYTVEHVCEMVRHVYAGRVIFHNGPAEVAPGIRVHPIGGHSRGLQAVEVATEFGPLCLASDATHYYENLITGKPFSIVVDMENMLAGFGKLFSIGLRAERIVPGHDPLVRRHFPEHGTSGFVWRLDVGAQSPIEV